MEILSQLSGITVTNRLVNPDEVCRRECAEILPHKLDGVIGDGNCLFRAISKELSGSEVNHQAVRMAAVNFLRLQPEIAGELFGAIRVQQEGAHTVIEQYLRDSGMEHLGWGSDVELQLLATILQTDIVVYSVQYRRWFAFTQLSRHQQVTQSAIYLCYRHNHYDRVVPNLSS